MTAPIVRDIRYSLIVLAGIVAFACIGLATDGNWPKLLRVATAFTAYATALAATGALAARMRLLLRFLGAGAIAGAISGIVRPELDAALAVASIAGGIAFGGTHWLGATRWRSLATAQHGGGHA